MKQSGLVTAKCLATLDFLEAMLCQAGRNTENIKLSISFSYQKFSILFFIKSVEYCKGRQINNGISIQINVCCSVWFSAVSRSVEKQSGVLINHPIKCDFTTLVTEAENKSQSELTIYTNNIGLTGNLWNV